MFNRDRATKFLKWAFDTFGPCAHRPDERAMRFLEEAMELAQSQNVSRDVMHRLVDRVQDRPPGPTPKEVGQCQATLETLSINIGLDPDEQAEIEWRRVNDKPPKFWKDRHDAKTAMGITTDSQ